MKMPYSFEPNTALCLLAGFLFLVFSIISFNILKKERVALLCLFTGALLLYSFSALLDPFLNNWDEQFHALVAKHLIEQPLAPALYKRHVISYGHSWIHSHIWLHKQPLFMWQIALSLKLFGLNEFAVRIPSVLMLSITPLFIYGIGKHTCNSRIGFYAALLFTSSYFVHELCSGRQTCDHNDTTFIFYITASVWAWVNFEVSGKKYWLLLIGVFAGAAVLVKWLVGLIVYFGWSLTILTDKRKRTNYQTYSFLLISLGLSLLVFIPWQIYTSLTFPSESRIEHELNVQHFFKVVEDHGGNSFYHYKMLEKQYGYGDLVPIIIIISLFFFYKSIKEPKYKIAFFSMITFVYTFFTLAATKMESFCFIVSPLIFLSLASLIDIVTMYISERLPKKVFLVKIIMTLMLIIICWGNFNLYELASKHSLMVTPDDNDKREKKINDTRFIKHLTSKLPKGYIIFNCEPERNIRIMFYSDFIAYDTQLQYDDYIRLKRQNYKLATFDLGDLPPFLVNDPAVLKIRLQEEPTTRGTHN
ncbi:MAG: glycosyl transferase family 39 [Bacteroidota bacterium]|jgi:4-amino-4-deoxy-L-arabinose transferase|nr:glycosyl transferase family 39 [Bacteroidota bacterium]